MLPLATLIASLAATSPAEVRVAVPGLAGVGVDERLAGFFSEHLASQLSLQGARVITSKEIGTLLGFERQRQLLVCAEDSNQCIAELANALGVDGILMGDVARLGATYQLNLKILAATDGRPLAKYAAQVESDEQMLTELSKAAREMGPALGRSLGRVLVPDVAAIEGYEKAQARRGYRSAAWIPAVAGGLLAAGGAVALVLANGNYRQLDAPTRTYSQNEARILRDDGATYQTLGWVGVGTSVAALGAATALYVLGSQSSAPTMSAGVVLLPGHAAATFAVSFP